MRKEKSVALLEHQLMEVEVRGSAQQGLGTGHGAGGLAQLSPFACLLPQEMVRQFRGAVGEQLGKMRVFLAALEGSLDREAERVRGEAGVALRRELGSLNSYLEQLRQMEKVLEEVADKPQTEFLMVSTWMTFPLCFSARVQGVSRDPIPLSDMDFDIQRGTGTRPGRTLRQTGPHDCCYGCLGCAV